MISDNEYQLARILGEKLQQSQWRIGTAESCTGGLIAAAITAVPGSSGWFDEGLVTYANESKQHLLGVSRSDLERFGAVSREVVEQMSLGVLRRGADVAVATSGIAGPDGGSDGKPVGTVWISWALKDQAVHSHVALFSGDREAIRSQAVLSALQFVIAELDKQITV